LACVRKIDPLGDSTPTYIQVAKDIVARIEDGEITHRLPAERAMAQEYGVAYETVRHSVKTLRERGLIITRHGRGSFVGPVTPSDSEDSGNSADGSTDDGR
jgi:GntR family transcriptional regulator